MANLVVSKVCNLNCPYCFAEDYLQEVRPASRSSGKMEESQFISLSRFESHLDFLARSGIDEIRLIGGEPTLHPKFPQLIEMAAKTSKRIVVFSHGLVPEHSLASLELLDPQVCTVLVNMNASGKSGVASPREETKRLRVIQRLGKRTLLGFTICRPVFDLSPLIKIIREYGCQRGIRLGIAQPMLTGNNIYLRPKDYPLSGRRIRHFALQAWDDGIRLEFDCGFVRCMFSERDLNLLRQTQADLGWRCNPILDIDLEGNVLHCFPLSSKFQHCLNGSSIASELRGEMEAKSRPYRQIGIYKECFSCFYKHSGECSGGCLANSMRRFKKDRFQVTIPAYMESQLNSTQNYDHFAQD